MASYLFPLSGLLSIAFLLPPVLLAENPLSQNIVLQVQVRTERGEVVSDLKADELTIRDTGQELPIVDLLGPGEPFHVGLLLDVSPSTQDRVEEIRNSTQSFFYGLREEDEGLIVTFDSEIYLDCDWTTDRRKIDEAIFEFGLQKPGEKSAIYDAVAATLERKFRGLGPRRAMLLLSDGVEIGSRDTKENESLEIVRKLGFPVFVVQFDASEHYRRIYQGASRRDPRYDPPVGTTGSDVGGIFVGTGRPSETDIGEYKLKKHLARATKYLRLVAEAGRAEYYMTLKGGDLASIYRQIADDLSGLYTLTVHPIQRRKADRLYPLTVSTTRPGIRVKLITPGYWPATN